MRQLNIRRFSVTFLLLLAEHDLSSLSCMCVDHPNPIPSNVPCWTTGSSQWTNQSEYNISRHKKRHGYTFKLTTKPYVVEAWHNADEVLLVEYPNYMTFQKLIEHLIDVVNIHAEDEF